MSWLTRDGTAEPVSRDQIFGREHRQGNIYFPCSADHVQDWQPYPVDPYSCYMCDHTYINTYQAKACGSQAELTAAESEGLSVGANVFDRNNADPVRLRNTYVAWMTFINN